MSGEEVYRHELVIALETDQPFEENALEVLSRLFRDIEKETVRLLRDAMRAWDTTERCDWRSSTAPVDPGSSTNRSKIGATAPAAPAPAARTIRRNPSAPTGASGKRGAPFGM